MIWKMEYKIIEMEGGMYYARRRWWFLFVRRTEWLTSFGWDSYAFKAKPFRTKEDAAQAIKHREDSETVKHTYAVTLD